MGRFILLLAVTVVLIVAGATCVSAEAGAATATAAPAVTAPPLTGPAILRAQVVRPAPSILPTLRLIDSEMLPTLGFLLTLTDDQKSKAQDLLGKSDDELKPKIAAQVKAASDYITLLGKPSASQADLTTAAQKVLAADSDLIAARIKAFVAFKAILTAEQNTRLAQELQQTASKWLPQPPAPVTSSSLTVPTK